MQSPTLDRPVAAVLAVVRRGSELLLVRRRNPPDAGLWGYPGGRIELGERLLEAACRELCEETGVLARADVPLSPLNMLDRTDEGGLNFHYVLFPVLCEWLEGEGTAADDAVEARWFDLPAIERLGVEASSDVASVARQALAFPGSSTIRAIAPTG